MKFLGNLIEIKSTKIDQYPGDTQGDSIIATLKGSAEKGETAQVHGQTGIIGNPPKGAKGLRIRIGSLDIVISSLNYGVSLPENPGETKVFSTDEDGNEVAGTNFKDDGTQEINGKEDFAVRFLELETAYNQLKSDHDDLVDLYNAHIHITTATVLIGAVGVISPTTSTGSPSTGDISDAKIKTIKVPELGEAYP